MIAEKIIKLDFAVIRLYDHYMIGKINEGTILDQEHLELLQKTSTNYFKNKPFIYISERTEDYNVNPVAYLKFSFSTNLLAIIIVTTKAKKLTAQFEEKFINKPFMVFTTFKEATLWAEDFYEKNR